MIFFGPPNIEKLKAKRNIRGLIKALKYKKEWKVAQAAALALGQLGDLSAVEPLIEVLADKQSDIRSDAAIALGQIGDARAVKPLIEALSLRQIHTPWYLRKVAAEALGKISDARAVEPLVEAYSESYGSSGNESQEATVQALTEIGAPAVEPLIKILNSTKKFGMREVSARVLGQVRDVRAVEPLIEALKDEDKDVRRNATVALEHIGSPAVDSLIRNLMDQENEVRAFTARTLGNIGDSRAVEPLIEVMNDKDYSVRSATIYALGQLGDARVVELLIKVLTDKESQYRHVAAAALGNIGDERAIEPLTTVLLDKEVFLIIAATDALDRLGWKPDKNELGAVYWIAKIRSEDTRDRQRRSQDIYTANIYLKFIEELIEIGPPAVEPLNKVLENEDDSSRRNAYEQALRKIGDANPI